MDYLSYTDDLERRMQILQKEYLATQDERALLLGPLLAITSLAKNNLLPFARDRYSSIMNETMWKIADDDMLAFRQEVELVLSGPSAFVSHRMKVG